MTRFLYIADTHLGASPMGYTQQKGFPERLPDILEALAGFIREKGGVDFVLHGGDMIDRTDDALIRAAVETFRLPVPVRLCLGNHDLTEPDAVERWLELAPDFFPGGAPDYTIVTPDLRLHVAPTQWEEVPYYWKSRQDPHFLSSQLDRLEAALRLQPDRPHLLATHGPVFGLPPEQTGQPAPLHAPESAFRDGVMALIARHRALRAVLGAHSHMNMRLTHEGVHYVTVSSLAETPFEFKLFETTPGGGLRMETLSLGPRLAIDAPYDASRAYVQGRAEDRAFE